MMDEVFAIYRRESAFWVHPDDELEAMTVWKPVGGGFSGDCVFSLDPGWIELGAAFLIWVGGRIFRWRKDRKRRRCGFRTQR